MLVIGVVSLCAFLLVEHRAKEPILPLVLFRNRTFTVTSSVGFIVGLSLFGAITFLPLYLQIVKGQPPTNSGLQLTPMMAGLLFTSILSGQLISRTGRYRPFPIIGTAIMTVSLLLLTTLAVDTPIWKTSLYMVVLGLGLGMVMQVLVLAVQNSVDYEYLGVATSGSTLFRQVGGSIGVSLFGAIFANQLQSQLRAHFPPGVKPADRRDARARRPASSGGSRHVRRGVLERAAAGVPGRGGMRRLRIPPHLAPARGAAARDDPLGGARRELRVPARRQLVPRAAALVELAREPREALGGVRAVRGHRRRRAQPAGGLAARAESRSASRSPSRRSGRSSGATARSASPSKTFARARWCGTRTVRSGSRTPERTPGSACTTLVARG